MAVLIQINGDTAGEAIKELSTLASGIAGQAVAAEAPKTSARNSRQTPKPDPVKETPVKDENPVEDPDQNDAEDESSDAPIPTDVELRALASEVGKKGSEAKVAIKKLLDKYGSANVTGVPDDKRLAFKRDLEKLAAEDAE